MRKDSFISPESPRAPLPVPGRRLPWAGADRPGEIGPKRLFQALVIAELHPYPQVAGVGPENEYSRVLETDIGDCSEFKFRTFEKRGIHI